MKLSAILVAVFFVILFPMLMRISLVIYMAVRGKDSHALDAPIAEGQRRKNSTRALLLGSAYLLATVLSISWGIYVFTGSKFWAAGFCGYLLIFVGIFFIVGKRSIGKPQPTLEELNRQADVHSKRMLKFIIAWVIFSIAMAITVAIISVVTSH
jgi:hypothetical protein